MTPTYVFVHGSGTNGRCWSATQQEMTSRGHRTIAVDLPGRGAGFSVAYFLQDLEAFAAEPSAIAGVTAAETIGHVVDVVRVVREHGPVVLVGHSFGGLVITAVGNAVPDLVDRIVYIAAQCPVDRAASAYLARPEWAASDFLPLAASLTVGNPAELGFIRVNWRGVDRTSIVALKNAIGRELTEQEFIGVISTCQPDEVLWQNDPEWDHRADKDTWGRIPHTFIRLAGDNSMPLAVQDLYITEADALTPDNPFEVFSVDSGHAGFFRRPGEVVDILTRFSTP